MKQTRRAIDEHYRERENHFADLLAEGLSMPQIKERMGLSHGGAHGMLGRIRAKLGWQAQ